jgi:error-prone DNA polymerase
LPLIATNGVSHATVEERELMDVLTCIRHKVTIAEAGRLLAKNSECHIKSSQEMARLFADLPEALSQARELAVRLSYTLADLGYQFPPYPVPEGETMNSFLRQLTVTGARDRYGSYQLLLDENGLGNHRTRTAGTGESGDRRNQM